MLSISSTNTDELPKFLTNPASLMNEVSDIFLNAKLNIDTGNNSVPFQLPKSISDGNSTIPSFPSFPSTDGSMFQQLMNHQLSLPIPQLKSVVARSRQNRMSSTGSMSSNGSMSSIGSYSSPRIDGETEADRNKRKRKNREAAKQYRERKKIAAGLTKQRVVHLQQENKDLQDQLLMYSALTESDQANQANQTIRQTNQADQAAQADTQHYDADKQHQKMINLLMLGQTSNEAVQTLINGMQQDHLFSLQEHTKQTEQLMIPLKEHQILMYLWLKDHPLKDHPKDSKDSKDSKALLTKLQKLNKAFESFHQIYSIELQQSQEYGQMIGELNEMVNVEQWMKVLQITGNDVWSKNMLESVKSRARLRSRLNAKITTTSPASTSSNSNKVRPSFDDLDYQQTDKVVPRKRAKYK